MPCVTPSLHVRARTLALLGLVLAVLAGTLVQAPGAAAYPGAPWFEPSKTYTQNFADPHVIRVGEEYYAYATGTGGSYLPVMRSTDLRNWVARDAYDPGGGLAQKYPGFNDALPYVASWGIHEDTGMHMTSWVTAPGVAKIGNTYNAYYGLWAQRSPVKHCISVATSSSPQGPFTDRTSQPLSCDADTPGDIDPYPFVDPASGIPYLLWASEGPGDNPPTKLWARQLAPDGLSWAPGSSMRELARTTQGWEGRMIENPAMIRYADRYFLLYSANDWWTDRYAIGYAECAGPLGPCQKPQSAPLLGNQGDKLGPGGQSLFLDTAGRLQMAYHHWTAPYVGYPTDPNCDGGGKCTSQGQRRLAVTELSISGAGLSVGPPRPTPTPTEPVLSDAPPAPGPVLDEPGIKRLAGLDRYATAARIVQDSFPVGPVPVVFVTTGEAFADALAGGPAADALGGPVLPVAKAGIPAPIRDTLDRLDPARIVVLGGPGAVSDAISTELQAFTTGAVTRYAGADRYDTAAKISRAVFTAPAPQVIVATGTGYADALAGGAVGAKTDSPVLLVTPDSLPAQTAAALRELQPRNIAVLGGAAAVSDAVLAQLQDFTTGGVTRLSGSTRYGTAANTVQTFWPQTASVAYLATGRNFADALAGVPAAGRDQAPLLLVEPNCMPTETKQQLDRLQPTTVVVLGGTTTVSDAAASGQTLCPAAQPAPDPFPIPGNPANPR